MLRASAMWCCVPILGIVIASSGCGKYALRAPEWKFAGWKVKAPNPEKKGFPKSRLAWAQLQESNGQHAEARDAYQACLKQDPKSYEATLGLARLDYLAHRVDDAEKGFKKAVKLAPKSPVPEDALGQFYAEQERYPEAIEHIRRAIELEPYDQTYKFHLGVVCAQAGQTDEALACFSQVGGKAAAHYNVGRILYDRRQVRASEEQFKLALAEDPGLEEARIWLEDVQQERMGGVKQSSGQRVQAPAPASANSAAQYPDSSPVEPSIASPEFDPELPTPAVAQYPDDPAPAAQEPPAATHWSPRQTSALGAPAPARRSSTAAAPQPQFQPPAVSPQPRTAPAQSPPAASGFDAMQLEQLRNQQRAAQGL